MKTGTGVLPVPREALAGQHRHPRGKGGFKRRMVWKQQWEACPARLKGVRCEPRTVWEEAESQAAEGPCGAQKTQKTRGHGRSRPGSRAPGSSGCGWGPGSDGGGAEFGERRGVVLVTPEQTKVHSDGRRGRLGPPLPPPTPVPQEKGRAIGMSPVMRVLAERHLFWVSSFWIFLSDL